MTSLWTRRDAITADALTYEVEEDVCNPSSLSMHRFRYRVKARAGLPERPWWAGWPTLYVSEHTARVDTELSHVWGRNNPELFVDAVTRFQEEHPVSDWERKVSMHRAGFLTLIAIKRKTPYKTDADFLREIGYGQ